MARTPNGIVLGLTTNEGNTRLDLANHVASGTWQKAIKSGVLAQLAGQNPEIKVGSTDFFTFTGTPKAELVGESIQKSNTGEAPSKVTAKTYKVQVTHRFSEEVMYADEDYKLQLIDTLVGRVGTAISRAVDLVAIHGINPLTGTVASVDQYIMKAGNGVHKIDTSASATADYALALRELATAGYSPTGSALDPVFALDLADERDGNSVLINPNISINGGSVSGVQAVVGDTVSARHEIAGGSGVVGVVGDFQNAFKWGVARNIGLRTLTSGDPDGNGDLARNNEIAIRAEAIFGFVFLENGAGFAAIGDSIASS